MKGVTIIITIVYAYNGTDIIVNVYTNVSVKEYTITTINKYVSMKELTSTKLYNSNKSVITTIPKTVLELENIDMKEDNKIVWKYEIKNNKIKYEIEFKKE